LHVVTKRDWLDAVAQCEDCQENGGKPCAFHEDRKRLIANA